MALFDYICRSVSHENVVGLTDVYIKKYTADNKLYLRLVFEPCEFSLLHLLNKQNSLQSECSSQEIQDKRSVKFFKSIVKGKRHHDKKAPPL